MGHREIIFIFVVVISGIGSYSAGQETSYFPEYQTVLAVNPAFAGSGDEGVLRISYKNIFPGNHYNFHTGYFSYDSYFNSIHGGAGFYISNDYLGGIINDIRGGLAYSYYLQAGRELFIRAGLSASFFHRGFNFSQAVFPDQIDQMGIISSPTSEIIDFDNTTVFDVATGFVFIYKSLSGGLAISHLTSPYLNNNAEGTERLGRKLTFSVMNDFLISKENSLSLKPLLSFEVQDDYFTVAAGSEVTYNSLTGNLVGIYDNYGNLNLSTGFSLHKDRVTIFYNYKFNVSSHNTFIPFSLMHQTGIILSLNKVEKRIKSGTIILPVM